MNEPWRWISRQALVLLHDESIAEHGGAAGIRDEGLLESALARPLNQAAYGSPDLAALAASYGVGLAKKAWLAVSRTPQEVALMRQLKATLDPLSLLNPGKVFDAAT